LSYTRDCRGPATAAYKGAQAERKIKRGLQALLRF